MFDIAQQMSVAAAENKTRRVLVLMAQKDKVEMEDAIAEKMPKNSPVRIICRSGDPTSLNDLAMANVGAAKAVIVVSPDDGNPDARNLKTILALTQAASDQKNPRAVVAEFRDSANVEAVHAIGGAGVQAVMADDLISRIIVHSSRQIGIVSGVFRSARL
ncbi:MAG: NAD-binding protein [Alphaproteobacteria bacterium]